MTSLPPPSPPHQLWQIGEGRGISRFNTNFHQTKYQILLNASDWISNRSTYWAQNQHHSSVHVGQNGPYAFLSKVWKLHRSDDLGPRRSLAFYWAGFLSHLVSYFKKRCQFGPLHCPFRSTVQCTRLKVLNSWSPVETTRKHGVHWVAVVAMQMVRDVRGTLTAPSPHSSCLRNWAEMQKRPPPAEQRPPASPVWTPHCSQAQGPWRPIASCASIHDTVIHAEGSPPGAWLLKEHPCGSGIMWVCVASTRLSVEDAWLSQT